MTTPFISLEGQVALVTGASRGIGRAIAEQLAALGAKVVGTATTESGAAAISAYLGDKGQGLVLNVGDTDSIEQCLETIKAQFGDIDILVNNAGITRDNLLMRMKEEEWFDIMQTNLTSVYRLSKAVLRSMMKKASRPDHQHRFSGRFDGECGSKRTMQQRKRAC